MLETEVEETDRATRALISDGDVLLRVFVNYPENNNNTGDCFSERVSNFKRKHRKLKHCSDK